MQVPDATPPGGIDPQVAGVFVTLAGALGAGLAKVASLIAQHRQHHERADLDAEQFQQQEAAAVFKESASLRQELRNEVQRLQRRVEALEARVQHLQEENVTMRRLLKTHGIEPPGGPWRPAFGG